MLGAPLLPSPLDEVRDDRLARCGVRLWLKRDDLIHPAVPGNKWRKLVPNLAAARDAGHLTLLTFGGAYSSHLRATAAAGALTGFATVGVVRGEAHDPLNPVLAVAAGQGMHLTYLDRAAYRRKDSPEVLGPLLDTFGPCYLLPEGGSNALAARGAAAIPGEIRAVADVDVVCVAVGTGGTIAGIGAGLGPGQRAIGFSALKGGAFLDAAAENLQREAFGGRRGDWRIETRYHHGGYARSTPELRAFAGDFAARHAVGIELVYVAKMLFGIYAMAERGELPAGSRIAAVITGPGP